MVDNLLALSMEEVCLKNKAHVCSRGCHKARLVLILLKMLHSVHQSTFKNKYFAFLSNDLSSFSMMILSRLTETHL